MNRVLYNLIHQICSAGPIILALVSLREHPKAALLSLLSLLAWRWTRTRRTAHPFGITVSLQVGPAEFPLLMLDWDDFPFPVGWMHAVFKMCSGGRLGRLLSAQTT